MNGGSPQAISVSPCWSLLMFWMPAPGTTLMLNDGSLLLMSSTKPPACVYQPPPTWPAVQVRLRFCASPGSTAANASASPSPRMVKRRMRTSLKVSISVGSIP